LTRVLRHEFLQAARENISCYVNQGEADARAALEAKGGLAQATQTD
jgi:hypothetical protein